jgi:hypothetical protein
MNHSFYFNFLANFHLIPKEDLQKDHLKDVKANICAFII